MKHSPVAPVVVVGAGQAGLQAAASLRQGGFDGPIRLVGDEGHLPYQRPPLSKAYLAEEKPRDSLWLRPEAFLAANAIDFVADDPVVSIDRRDGHVHFAGGSNLRFDKLILATGTRNRRLAVPGADLAGALGLRSIADAEALRERLATAEDVVVVGAGFVGLEVAATAVKGGRRVTVIEAAERPMQRAVSPVVSGFYRAAHTHRGVAFRFGAGVIRLIGEDGRVRAVETRDGEVIRADLVLVGIGVVPNAELAAEAGLSVADGIVVDESLGTADPRIFAIGDCARHPSRHAPGPVRIESVQNATDQARLAAARILGAAEGPYAAVPWFWSDQGDLKLQIAGLSHGVDRWVTRGEPDAGAFSVFGYRAGRLAVVESVGKPHDHMVARRLLAAGTGLPPDAAGDLSIDLKALVRA